MLHAHSFSIIVYVSWAQIVELLEILQRFLLAGSNSIRAYAVFHSHGMAAQTLDHFSWWTRIKRKQITSNWRSISMKTAAVDVALLPLLVFTNIVSQPFSITCLCVLADSCNVFVFNLIEMGLAFIQINSHKMVEACELCWTFGDMSICRAIFDEHFCVFWHFPRSRDTRPDRRGEWPRAYRSFQIHEYGI